jgi:hypothetical protein
MRIVTGIAIRPRERLRYFATWSITCSSAG